MKIIISNSSSVPIYEQIKNAIKTQIMNGELAEDEALPSIRNLAQDIKISVMTIKRLMMNLRLKDILFQDRGKGLLLLPKILNLRENKPKEILKVILKKL